MATVIGGKRLLLIQQSFFDVIHDGLEKEGWLTPNPGVRKDVNLLPRQLDDSEAAEPNMLAISFEGFDSEEVETGSTLERNEMGVYIDIFAEDEFIGMQIAGDVRDILRGKFVSHGRSGSLFTVYDASGNPIFDCDIENVQLGRVREYDKPSKRYWWVVGGIIVDHYEDEDD